MCMNAISCVKVFGHEHVSLHDFSWYEKTKLVFIEKLTVRRWNEEPESLAYIEFVQFFFLLKCVISEIYHVVVKTAHYFIEDQR